MKCKPAVIACALAALLLGLTACRGGTPSSSAPVSLPPSGESPANGFDPMEDQAIDPMEFVDPQPIKLPDAPAYEPPDMALIPLISSARYYKDPGLQGAVSFLDENDRLVEPPAEAAGYTFLRGYAYTGAEDAPYEDYTACILLLDEEENMAIMRCDGRVVTGFDYGNFFDSEYGPMYTHSTLGYITMDKPIKTGEESLSRFGVVDIRTGEEVVPFEYDRIGLFDGYIIAGRGSDVLFLDYAGNVLYAYEDAFFKVGEYDRSSQYEFGDDAAANRYYFNIKTRMSGNDAPVLYCAIVDNFVIYIAPENRITIRDRQGNHLISRPDFYDYSVLTDSLIALYDYTDILVVSLDGSGYSLTPPGDNVTVVRNIKYADGRLTFQLRYGVGDDWRLAVMEPDGTLVSLEPTEQNEPSPGFCLEDGIYWRIDGSDAGYRYQDENGTILIPEGLYDYMRKTGDFLLAYEDSYDRYDVDIYDTAGRLLIDGTLGDMGMRGERIFIYKDEGTAGWLSPDGTFAEVTVPRVVRWKLPE